MSPRPRHAGAASSPSARFPRAPPRPPPRPRARPLLPAWAEPAGIREAAGCSGGGRGRGVGVAVAVRPQRGRRRKPRGQRPTRGDPLGGSAPRPAPPRPSRSGGWGGAGVGGGPGGTEAGSAGRLFPRPHPAELLRARAGDAGASESPAGNGRRDHMVMGGSSGAALHWPGAPHIQRRSPGTLTECGAREDGEPTGGLRVGRGRGPSLAALPAWGKASCLLSSPQTRSPGTRGGAEGWAERGAGRVLPLHGKKPHRRLRRGFAGSISAGAPAVPPGLLEPPCVARGGLQLGKQRSGEPRGLRGCPGPRWSSPAVGDAMPGKAGPGVVAGVVSFHWRTITPASLGGGWTESALPRTKWARPL